jgi:hypothetical protein
MDRIFRRTLDSCRETFMSLRNREPVSLTKPYGGWRHIYDNFFKSGNVPQISMALRDLKEEISRREFDSEVDRKVEEMCEVIMGMKRARDYGLCLEHSNPDMFVQLHRVNRYIQQLEAEFPYLAKQVSS